MMHITIFVLNYVDFIENEFLAANGFGKRLFDSPTWSNKLNLRVLIFEL